MLEALRIHPLSKGWTSGHLWVPAIRLLSGTAFLLAGAGKLPEGMQFVDAAVNYHVLPYAVAWGYGVVPWLELTVGLLFISGAFAGLAAAISLPLILSFIAANSMCIPR